MKKNPYSEVAKIYDNNASSIHEIVKKKKEICASFAIPLQTAKVRATMHDKCLVNMRKASYLWAEDMNYKCFLMTATCCTSKR